MKKELYYAKADAMQAATEFCKEVCEPIFKDTYVTDRERFTYKDRDAHNTNWSGETPAINVVGQNDEGCFAYLSEHSLAVDELASKMIWAICTINSDPWIVVNEEMAIDAAEYFAGKQIEEIYDCDDDWEDCLAKLDLTKADVIYKVVNGDGLYCLDVM